MKRTLVVLSVAIAACSAGDPGSEIATGDTSAPVVTEPLSTDQPVLTTTASETIDSTSTTTTDPAAEGLVTLFDGSSDIDPLDMTIDEDRTYFNARSNRPFLSPTVSERWATTNDRFTMTDAFAFGGLLVTWQQSRERVHSLVARDIATGEQIWRFEADGWKFIDAQQSGDLLLVSATKGGASDDFLVDLIDGTELPLVGPVGYFWGEGFLTRGNGGTGDGFEVFDPRSDSVAATIVPVGQGFNSIVSDTGEALVEISTTDFQVVSSEIDIGQAASGRGTVAAFADAVLVLTDETLQVHSRSGELVDSIPFPGPYGIEPMFGSTETLLVRELDGTFGVDVDGFVVKWTRPGIVNQLGVFGGEAFATFEAERDTEVFSVDTGETRCVLGDGLFRKTQDGFFDGSTAYNFECEPIWIIEDLDNSKSLLVDGGVITAQRMGEQTMLRFFG